MVNRKPGPKLVLFDGLADLGAPLGRRNVDRLESLGDFPKRVLISKHRIAWVVSEVVDWINARMAARSHELGVRGSKPQRRAAPRKTRRQKGKTRR